MNPILFLDIDGVLNSWGWSQRRIIPPMFQNLKNWEKDSIKRIDHEAVNRINIIQAETSCSIVLSSTWRKSWSLGMMDRILRRRGARFNLLGATPVLYTGVNSRAFLERGDEISKWLEMLGGTPHYAILDDDSDMTVHMDHLVQTDCKDGIIDEHIPRVIELLRG